MREGRLRTPVIAALVASLALPSLAACGEGDGSADDEVAQPAPDAAAFPDADGRSLEQIAAEATPGHDLVVSPAGLTFTEGRNRFGFAVFTVERDQITDAEVAIYAAPGPDGEAEGPFTARIENLETEPAFVARNTAADPDAAKAVYVTNVPLDKPGEWRLLALVRRDDQLYAVRMPSIIAKTDDQVPAPGEPAPKVHTPTAADVGGNLAEIDTRVPPATMHEHDLADVLGEQPVVLLFATPALCESRVCGPVVDVAEQVKRDLGDEAAFIHSEIYVDNNPNEGPRKPVRAFNLPSEPWLFVIDREGRIDTRIQGAFSAAELTAAVERVAE